MTRRLRIALAAGARLALLVGASPVGGARAGRTIPGQRERLTRSAAIG